MSHGGAALADITQGRRVWRREGPGFGAQLVAYPPRREMPRHSHRTANITVILAGSCEEEVEGGGHLCGPLSVVVKPAGAVHATAIGPAETRSLVVDVEGELEEALRRRYGLFDACRWFHVPCGLAPAVLGLCRWLRQGADAAEDAAPEWFSRIGEAASAAPRPASTSGMGVHVRRAVEIMQCERSLPTRDLAQRLGLHPVYVARLFRQRLGCSPGRFRQGLRLAAALDRIVRSGQTLGRVAVESGFADHSHMSRQVKRRTGMTAGAVRALASGPREDVAARFHSF